MYRVLVIFVSFFILVVSSCDKSGTEENGNIYGKWNATDLMSVESFAYSKKDSFKPEIEFNEDGTYHLKLEMNTCTGSFTLSAGNGISLSASGCTKICCDSEFSQKFVQMLPQVKSYNLENNKLKLEVPGWGWIEVELNN